jgi:DNA-binding MarR family transcriptional regulator
VHPRERDNLEAMIEAALTALVFAAVKPHPYIVTLRNAGLPLAFAAWRLTPVRYAVLNEIDIVMSPTPTHLARNLRIDKTTLSRHLARLHRDRLIYAARDPGDHRVWRVRLTVEGLNALRQIRQARASDLSLKLAEWRPHERWRLAELLWRLVEAQRLTPCADDSDGARSRARGPSAKRAPGRASAQPPKVGNRTAREGPRRVLRRPLGRRARHDSGRRIA